MVSKIISLKIGCVFILFFSSSSSSTPSSASVKPIDFLINGGFVLILTFLGYYALVVHERLKLDSLLIPRSYSTMPFFDFVNNLEPAFTIFLPGILLTVLIVFSLSSLSSMSTYGTSGLYSSVDNMKKDLANVKRSLSFFVLSCLFLLALMLSASDYYSYIYIPLFLIVVSFAFVYIKSIQVIDSNDDIPFDSDKRHLNIFDRRIFMFSFGLMFLFLLPNVLVLYTLMYQSNQGLDILIMDLCTSKKIVEEDVYNIESKVEKSNKNKEQETSDYYICKAVISENKDGYVTWKNLYIKKEDLQKKDDFLKISKENPLKLPVTFDEKIYKEEIKSNTMLKEVSLDWDVDINVYNGIKSNLSLFVISSDASSDFTDQKKTKSIFQLLDKSEFTN